MKQFKVLVALVLATIMVIGMMSIASAATVTINRHSTWNNAADEKMTTYTPYKIFDADLTDANHPVYTISGTDADAKVNVLPSIFTAKLGADGKYYITLTNSNTSAADIVTALTSMVNSNPSLFLAGTATTTDATPAEVTVADNAYSLILASNGKNVAVQTVGDSLTIDEKNDYPKIDKQQKKAAGQNYGNEDVEAEIGKVIDYKIIVDIPADANKAIAVIDKMSAGLTYNDNFEATIDGTSVTSSDLTSGDAGFVSSAPTGYTIPFQKKFDASLVEQNQGKQIIITYTATVNAGALVPTGRENVATLVYDNGNYVLHDSVNYTTYFGGIEKVDGTNTSTKLDGVKFAVTVGGVDFNVQGVDADNDSVIDYYIPGGNSNKVVTGTNGKIIIRGLDYTVTYTLTETETKDGYNLLDAPQNLTLVEDDGVAYTTATYSQVQNFKGTVLPSTGGIGTTIFYVAGLILVLGAATILVARRKAESDAE